MTEKPPIPYIQFLEEESRSVCKRISELCKKNREAEKRIKNILDGIGATFLEELPIDALKFMLRMEIEEDLIEEAIKRLKKKLSG